MPVTLGPAGEADLPLICECVSRFALDGERLAPEQFLVARDEGRVVAFGRIKPYEHCHELGTVAVLEEARGRGYARLIVDALVARFPSPDVWITTDRPEVFSRLGFRQVPEAPPELERKLARIGGWKPNVVTMHRRREDG